MAGRLERHTCSPAAYSLTMRDVQRRRTSAVETDPRADALLHRRDDPIADIAHGRYLSREIRSATLVELPGAEHMYFLGSQGPALEAIRTFIDTHVAGGALRRAVKRVERKSSYGAGWDSLTPSEREVAALIAQGLTNAAIAKRLRISRFTVDGRLRRVFAKLAVSTRVEVSAEYFRSSER
jgi:DNA-binding CsgD family transcriptional regulator